MGAGAHPRRRLRRSLHRYRRRIYPSYSGVSAGAGSSTAMNYHQILSTPPHPPPRFPSSAPCRRRQEWPADARRTPSSASPHAALLSRPLRSVEHCAAVGSRACALTHQHTQTHTECCRRARRRGRAPPLLGRQGLQAHVGARTRVTSTPVRHIHRPAWARAAARQPDLHPAR